MAPEDDARQRDRQKLIEEIRRRAEEAELRRIEDEELRSRKLGSLVGGVQAAPGGTSSPPPEPASSAPVAPEPPEPPADTRPAEQPSPPSLIDQRLVEVREKLEIALDRGLAEKAAPLLTTLAAIVPDDPGLQAYRDRLAALEERSDERGKKRQPESRAREDAPRGRAAREAQKKKIAEQLERANGFYQQEKYDRALEELSGVLEADPEHSEARELKAQVEKARALAEQIREEEVRRRADYAPKVRPPAPGPDTQKDSGSVWGAQITTAETQTVFEAPEEKAAEVANVRKTPLVDRVVRRAGSIRLPIRTLITAGIVLVTGLLAWFIVDAIRHTVFPPKYSLLVFPATTSVTDGSLDYLTEGITEGLITDLSVVKEIRLLAPVSVMRFVDPRMQTQATVSAQGVGAYVLWSVERAGDQVVIQAALYDTTRAAARWTMQFRRSLRELPALRQEIARTILKQMEVQLTPEEEARFRGRAPAPEDAQETYLQARYLLRHAEETLLDSALARFTLARIQDPGSAETESGLGWAHVLAYEQRAETSRTDLNEALRSVQAAIALDRSSAEATRVWALVSHYTGEHARALTRMEEAVRLAPADAETRRRLAVLALVVGRPDDALNASEAAMSLDPFNETSYTVAGLVRNYRGQFAAHNGFEASDEFAAAAADFAAGARLSEDRSLYTAVYAADIDVYRQEHERAAELLTDRVARVRDSATDLYRLGRVLQSGGRPVPEWQEAFRRARALLETRTDAAGLALLALVHTRLGEFKEASVTSARSLALAPGDDAVLYAAARMHALQRGNEQQALDLLAKAVDKRYRLEEILDMDFFSLRSSPGFLTAITR